MNASQSYYGDEEFTYRVDGASADRNSAGRSGNRPSSARRSKTESRRRGKSPSQHNGIHRRRKKRITW